MKKIDNSIIEIDLDNCTKCKACVNDCVAHLFYIVSEELQVTDDFVDRCILCGHCVAVCPVDVITLKIHKNKPIRDLYKTEETPDFDSLYKLALKRRSIRQFKAEPVSKDLIEKLLELARYSPTGNNTENVFYTIVQNKQNVTNISNYITTKVKRFVESMDNPKGRELLKTRMSKDQFDLALENLPKNKAILKSIDDGIDYWCWDGQLIFIHGDSTIGGIPSNSALAAAHIMLAAETLGLGTCSLGYLTYYTNQSDTIKKWIELPENHEVGYSLVIGYPKIKYKRIPSRKLIRVQWL
jgi:nitroreductase/NAD-dependent dihydropyrimidine dehydrogenase PreA subunit